MNVLQIFVFCTVGWAIINGYDFWTGADVDWNVRIMNFITSLVVIWLLTREEKAE